MNGDPSSQDTDNCRRQLTQRRDWYCHDCDRWFHWLGIARHRAAHRDRGETADIVKFEWTTRTRRGNRS